MRYYQTVKRVHAKTLAKSSIRKDEDNLLFTRLYLSFMMQLSYSDPIMKDANKKKIEGTNIWKICYFYRINIRTLWNKI